MHLLRYTTRSLPRSVILDVSEPVDTYLSDRDEGLQRWSSVIGILIAIAGNILISFALNIQRLAHIKVQEDNMDKIQPMPTIDNVALSRSRSHVRNIIQGSDEYHSFVRPHSSQDHLASLDQSDLKISQVKTYLSSPYWWIGIFMMTVGESGNFLAYGFAPASIVSPLGVVALISNCLIAPILLKERFRLRDFWGVMVAITGAVTVVLSAKQKEQKLGPHEITEAIMRTEFRIYMILTVFLIGVLAWASPKYGNKMILIDLGLVGLLGGYTALSTKGISSMLSSTFLRALTTPITYLLLFILVVTAVMQVRYLNKALQRFDSTQVIPVQFVAFTISVIVGSSILYRDLEKITAYNAAKLICGCLLAFLGVWLITSGRPANKEYNSKKNLSHEQVNLLSFNEGLEPTRGSTPSGNIAEIENPRAINMKRSSTSHALSHSTPKFFPISEQRTDAIGLSSEESPLLDKKRTSYSKRLMPAFNSLNLRPLSAQSLDIEAQNLTINLSKPLSTSVKPHLAHALTTSIAPQSAAQSIDSPLILKLELPVTSSHHPISRLITGPLISPLSGGLSGATADSFRRGVNSSINGRPRKLHHCSSLHLIKYESTSGLCNSVDPPNEVDEQRSSHLGEDDFQKSLLGRSLGATIIG
ncbi:NIPA-like protein 2 [Golovinomyces cichoracearum]|uniref:NIPA-like protein 2 n=1 Tax=Golovinomyces cichoracearum TaxID=62708 RepID=A0A420HES3_9PEZI|nr:NIPA-like protein 2 [Golovinomyces cichoracearum]